MRHINIGIEDQDYARLKAKKQPGITWLTYLEAGIKNTHGDE